MDVKTFTSETGEFSLPGVKEFMKGSIKYLTIEKETIKRMIESTNLAGDMIQALGSQCEVQMDVLNNVASILTGETKTKLDRVYKLFAKRYDALFTNFLQAMQDITGMDVDLDNLDPGKERNNLLDTDIET